MASKVAIILSFKKVKVVLLLQEWTSSIQATAMKVLPTYDNGNILHSPPTLKSCYQEKPKHL